MKKRIFKADLADISLSQLIQFNGFSNGFSIKVTIPLLTHHFLFNTFAD